MATDGDNFLGGNDFEHVMIGAAGPAVGGGTIDIADGTTAEGELAAEDETANNVDDDV
ncbi:hypothetical protein KV557_25070 [Kitasatospora aureofaciens]|uniref:hypothetical protein n=1 Tax=Kitasatospora aureofaciens TaxID=1894 RepID=UPI001C48F1DE|nr:hypothetical protein [Kitasatospora aureofaciens]MBV6700339.1 hypothetical protein [Kitasatospora aureofaciens]